MKNNTSPLMLTVIQNNKEIFDYLIDKDDLLIDAQNNDQDDAFTLAI